MSVSIAFLALSAAALQAAQPLPVIVYFGDQEDKLAESSIRKLDQVAEAYRNGSGPSVYLSGHTDRYGDAASNVLLSQRRANAARDYLVSRGVPAGVITTMASGELDRAVETADGVKEPYNNRVEVTFGPAPGW